MVKKTVKKKGVAKKRVKKAVAKKSRKRKKSSKGSISKGASPKKHKTKGSSAKAKGSKVARTKKGAAAKKGIPLIAAPGGTDFVAWPVPPEEMPAQYRNRFLRMHNPNTTGVPLSKEERAEIGRLMAQELNRATGPVAVVLPLRGVSGHDEPGGEFYDPDGREALAQSLKQYIAPQVEVVEVDANINDPVFSRAVMSLFDNMM